MKQPTNHTAPQRALFATRLGVVAVTVGSAVGLGNIWRFPYEAGTNGGGAFILCYLFFIFIIGIPVICAEFVMGRETRSGILGAYRKLSGGRRYDLAGYSGVLAALLILSFYSVVAGWTMAYTVESATGALHAVAANERHAAFAQFISGSSPVAWAVAFLLINAVVLLSGVQKGIERISNILMPLLFVILLAFCINSFTMPQCAEGLRFLFNPDFSAITPGVILSAMGQAFFSLSIGLGCLMTYASYFRDDTPLARTATTTALLDTLVAVMAGVVIFPAVFSFGMAPAEGPTLVFEVLPNVFENLPMSSVWSTMFFFLLFLASLTSTISMCEIIIAFLCDEWQMSRTRATLSAIGLGIVLASICALSFGPLSDYTLFGLTAFNLFDFASSNVLLPLGGMTVSLYVGWKLNRATLARQLSSGGRMSGALLWLLVVALRFVAPACIAAVFVAGLL
jgi:NSS family neurotransmitter:Na+ symporter